jgi:hypothetical protein
MWFFMSIFRFLKILKNLDLRSLWQNKKIAPQLFFSNGAKTISG